MRYLLDCFGTLYRILEFEKDFNWKKNHRDRSQFDTRNNSNARTEIKDRNVCNNYD